MNKYWILFILPMKKRALVCKGSHMVTEGTFPGGFCIRQIKSKGVKKVTITTLSLLKVAKRLLFSYYVVNENL